MSNFRIGIIGGAGGQGGSWGARVRLWKKLQGYDLKLAAICDKNTDRLPTIAKLYGCVPYDNYNTMLEKEQLDAVIIATPHFLHAPMAIAAAEHGVNVLCEKPMCINLKQADEMRAAVEKYKIKLAVGFQQRFNPLYVGLKNAIQSGDLGEIFQINMLFHWWRKEDYYLNSSPVPENANEDWEGWRGHWKTEGAGALANQMVHYLDVFQWLSPSPIQAVTATSRVSKHTFVETDDNTNAIVEFQNGSMGLIQAGVAYEYGKEEEFGIFGTKGALVRRNNVKGILGIPGFYEDYRNAVLKASKRVWTYMPKLTNPSKSLLKNFLEAIRTDNSAMISVDVKEGRKAIELIRAILLSQTQKKKIEFPVSDVLNEYPTLLHTYVDEKFKDQV